MRRAEFHELLPERFYAVGHAFGDSYSGPGGGYLFDNGVIREPVSFYQTRQNSLCAVAGAFFEWSDDHELRWTGAEWLYEPVTVEPEPEPEPEPVEELRRKCAGTTAAGNQCKRWAMAGEAYCKSHVC